MRPLMLKLPMIMLGPLTGRKNSGYFSFKRHTMYHVLKKALPDLDDIRSALSISHSIPLVKYLAPSSSITEANFPEVNTLHLPYEDNSFPLVVSDQVLEHVEGDPARAVSELIRVTAPGGTVIITTCFINPVHGAPSDFWRFTPDALALLVNACEDKTELLELGQWGNYYLHILYAFGLSQRTVKPGRNPVSWLARYNQPNWPISTWIAVRKLSPPPLSEAGNE